MSQVSEDQVLTVDLIAESRTMFCAGCTPFQLIEHLYQIWDRDGDWGEFVSNHFWQAFGIHFFPLSESFESSLKNQPLQDHFNTEILHAMVASFREWSAGMNPEEIAQSWLNDVSATDIWTATDRFDPLASAETAKMWPALDESSRKYVRMNIVSGQVNYETALILARLMETIQRKTPRLEVTHALASGST